VRLLSFDTSTSTLFACAMQDGEVLVERRQDPGANRQDIATMLLPVIDEIVREAGWSKSQIQAIVAGQGPGSFTGVRTGVVTARTLAQALKLPLLGVSRLECLGRVSGPPVAVILPGAADHFFIAAYAQSNGAGMQAIVEPAYVNSGELKERISDVSRWAADESIWDTLCLGGRTCESLPVIKNIAVTQAQIAWDRLSLLAPSGASVDLERDLTSEFPWSEVEPLYLRGASVTIKKSHGDSHKPNDAK
jgi:tRNA threonylcarbamoyl adenosine modification protein YeaZ